MAQRPGAVGVERAEQRALRRPQLDRALERERGARGGAARSRRADPSAATMRRCAAARGGAAPRTPSGAGGARHARAARRLRRVAERRVDLAPRPGRPRAGLVVGVGAPPLAAAGRRQRVEGATRGCTHQNQTGGGARRARRRGARAAARTRCRTARRARSARRAHHRQRRAARRRRRAAAAARAPPAATALLSQLQPRAGVAEDRLVEEETRREAVPLHDEAQPQELVARAFCALPQRRELVGGAAVRRLGRARAVASSGATGWRSASAASAARSAGGDDASARQWCRWRSAVGQRSSGASTRSSSPGSGRARRRSRGPCRRPSERDRAHEFGGLRGPQRRRALAVLARCVGTVISRRRRGRRRRRQRRWRRRWRRRWAAAGGGASVVSSPKSDHASSIVRHGQRGCSRCELCEGSAKSKKTRTRTATQTMSGGGH